jgi:hypothetical protein
MNNKEKVIERFFGYQACKGDNFRSTEKSFG